MLFYHLQKTFTTIHRGKQFTVAGSQFTVFSMNCATIEAFWMLISTVNGYYFSIPGFPPSRE